jgi:hypothetical protein
MQSIRLLTKQSQFGSGLQAVTLASEPIVAPSARSSALRALCLVFSLTLGWIVLFDPSLVSGLSFHDLASFLRSL